ncbi:MAG: hypothetical protein WC709_09355 [Thermoleophilia bacterium]
MNDFRAGLRNRNPVVLVLAALLVLPALLGMEYCFTSGAWTAVPLKYWIRSLGDGLMYVSWTAADLKREPPDAPLVALTGGSGGREGIWTGEALSADVAALGGPEIVGANLSCPAQSFGETLAIVDTLPRAPTTVLVGVSIGRFTRHPEASLDQAVGRRLLLKSDTLRQFAATRYGEHRYSPTILPGVLQSLATWLYKRASNWEKGNFKLFTFVPHTFDLRELRRPETAAHKAKVQLALRSHPEALAARLKTNLDKNLAFNAALLDELVRRGQERGLDIVLLQLPHNPVASEAAFGGAFAACRDASTAIAAKYGVPYVDFNDELELTGADFYDFSHLRPGGRTIWQARLARELARLYRSGAIAGGQAP